jgi:hypothetical protein
MDASVLKTVGEVAGAGGVVLFLAIFFFRDVLTSKLAERLSRQQAARTINVMIFGVLGLAAAGGLTALLVNQKAGCSTTAGNITITQGDTNTTVLGTGCGNTSVTR